MERIPLDGRTSLHEIVAGLYNLLLTDELAPEAIELYLIDSEHVEAEIDFPYVGVNRAGWEGRWSPERKLEVLLHELAHVEEGADEADHGQRFYERLAELAAAAEAQRGAVEALFGAPIDFGSVRRHLVDSVNEHTVEHGTDTVEDRRRALREALSTADPPG